MNINIIVIPLLIDLLLLLLKLFLLWLLSWETWFCRDTGAAPSIFRASLGPHRDSRAPSAVGFRGLGLSGSGFGVLGLRV